MPSRSSRSRSRSSSKRHKKSHKRSRKRSEDRSPLPSPPSTRKDEGSNGSDSNGPYKPRLPSIMLPPSFLAKLEPKEEEKTPPAEQSPSDSTTNTTQITKKRKRRWMGDETVKVFLPHMPTTISAANMSEQEQKIYLLKLQVEELTRRLKVNDLGISANVEESATNDLLTSPSPEPIYDQQGKRQNTREVRTRRKIEDERHQLVAEILTLNPEYKPPADYRPQVVKFTEKVMIPQEDHPEVNFVGLIIGPRGSTLKTLEKDTGAKIIIRGKGSLKDGKMGLVKHGPMPGEDEPLHAYITGPTLDSVTKAGEKVQEIINQSIDAPEGLNELRKQQLRQLALLNGTLRENDSLIKLKLMGEAEKIITNTIICTICGGAGHVPSDCKFRRNPDGTFVDPTVDGSMLFVANPHEQQKLDCEYQSLMNELSGKKDTESTALSEAERRSLMSGSKAAGPTLAITNGSSSATDTKPGTTTIGSTSFNANGAMKTDYNPPSLMSLSTNPNNSSSNQSSYHNNSQSTSSNYSSSSFSNTGPRYNNNDVFDGYHLLRRHNRNNNYSSYIEGDSYRAQHIPALMENGGGSSQTNSTSSSSWSNSSYSQQNYYPNQQWNQWSQYNTSMYYQNAYQQQYYQNSSSTSTGFVPPLPKAPPPPPPPPV